MPPQQFPSMLGPWVGSGTATFVDAETGARFVNGCELSWGVSSQTGGEFSGSAIINGTGAGSDPYCTHSGTLSAVMTADGTLTSLRLQPGLGASRCTRVSGDGLFTGTVTNQTSFSVQTTDRWVCADPLGRNYNAERTVTLSLQKR